MDGRIKGCGVSGANGPNPVLQPVPQEFDGIQLGRIRRQKFQADSALLKECDDLCGTMRAEVVEDDGLAGLQAWKEVFLAEREEDLLVRT